MTRHLIEFQSKYLLRKTEVILYIPGQTLVETIQSSDDYHKSFNTKYPLMLLLSGFGSNKTAWEQRSTIVEIAKKHKIAVCLIGGENKWYMNINPADNWEGFLNIELPEFLYSEFNHLDRSLPLYIAGCSMGGYGALRNYLLNIDKYKACCSLSPAIRPDNNLEELLHAKKLSEIISETKDIKKNVYLSIGTKDFVYNASMEFDKFLEKENCGFRYKSVEGYDHSYSLWNLEIDAFLDYCEKLD